MPVDDWTRVDAGIFHAFHTSWISKIMGALNMGLLPKDHYALIERSTRRSRHVVIRHISGHHVVALIEIVSPSNKDRKAHVRELAQKVINTLEGGVHVLLIDLLPPTAHDPGGLHAAVWRWFDTAAYEPPADRLLTLVSYAWDGNEEEPKAYLEPVSVGQALIDMPLFLTAERYVNLPLEPTYRAAYQGMPEFWRDVLEHGPPDA